MTAVARFGLERGFRAGDPGRPQALTPEVKSSGPTERQNPDSSDAEPCNSTSVAIPAGIDQGRGLPGGSLRGGAHRQIQAIRRRVVSAVRVHRSGPPFVRTVRIAFATLAPAGDRKRWAGGFGWTKRSANRRRPSMTLSAAGQQTGHDLAVRNLAWVLGNHGVSGGTHGPVSAVMSGNPDYTWVRARVAPCGLGVGAMAEAKPLRQLTDSSISVSVMA